ncbi:DUF4339 domain-containing protein [Rubritalea tangerina]|uniref:DUF4339 domain-containing protein n=1 Tax=Rubritalea tangerina TaxID=430798 RepID=A0ABW4ZEN0_9BACT
MWYYTLNGQQAGPISQAELAQKLSTELTPDTLVWQKGMTDWLPAKQVPAFQTSQDAAIAPPPSPSSISNPYATPNTSVAPDLDNNTADEIPETPIPLDIGFCVSHAWKVTTSQFGNVFLVWFVYILLSFAIAFAFSMVASLIDGPSTAMPVDSFNDMTPEEALAESLSQSNQPMQWGALIMEIPKQILTTYIGLGLTFIGLNLLRGREASPSQLFSQSASKLIKVLLASILYGLIVGIGLIFLVIPGIYLGIRLMFYHTAIVDKDLGIIESLKYSLELTRSNTLSIFGLCILNILIVIAGAIALLVGLIWAIPVTWLSILIAYCYLHRGEQSIAHHSNI